MTPSANRVFIDVDYGIGTGYVQSNESCTDDTSTNCQQANSLVGAFTSSGGVDIDFAIGNSLAAHTPILDRLKISAHIDIVPTGGGGVCIFGSATRFPAVEAYYDLGGSTSTIFQQTEVPLGVLGLAVVQRSFPPCQTTEVPPFLVPPPAV